MSQVPEGWTMVLEHVPATLSAMFSEMLAAGGVVVTSRDSLAFGSYNVVSSQDLLVRNEGINKARDVLTECDGDPLVKYAPED